MTDLDDPRIDELYQSPLDAFVATRNRLATALKKEGAVELAKAVKALRKPSPPAWAVNQLYWQRRDRFSQLVTAGDRSRLALTNPLLDAVEAETARAEAVREAVSAARDVVAEHGMKWSDALERRITTTLEALAAYGSLNPQPCRGRLAEEVATTGFGAFAGIEPGAITKRALDSPSGPSSPPPTKPDPDVERRAALARERRELEAKREAGASRLGRLTAELESLRSRARDLEERIGAARSELGALEARLGELKDLPPRGTGGS